MPRTAITRRAKPTIEFVSGSYYWIMLDDGVSFRVFDWLPEGPHLVRLDHIDGSWTARMLDRASGNLDIGEDPHQRIVRGFWMTAAFWGQRSIAQEVRITWLARVEAPTAPSDVKPM